MEYPITSFTGLEDRAISVHLCRPFVEDRDMVELATDGVVVLSEEEFERMVEWVRGHFARLSKKVRVVQ